MANIGRSLEALSSTFGEKFVSVGLQRYKVTCWQGTHRIRALQVDSALGPRGHARWNSVWGMYGVASVCTVQHRRP